MKLHINEIIPFVTYFKITTGRIDKIRFTGNIHYKISSINDSIITHHEYEYEKGNFTAWSLTDDLGIINENPVYMNDLNAIFKSFQEANLYIQEKNYQEKLKDHFDRCDLFDDLFDDYSEESYDSV